jgi:hypothetical protein
VGAAIEDVHRHLDMGGVTLARPFDRGGQQMVADALAPPIGADHKIVDFDPPARHGAGEARGRARQQDRKPDHTLFALGHQDR